MTTLITRDDLKAAIEAGEVTVVDALPAGYFEQQHLPGAVNLFVDEAADRAAEVLPDKDAAIVAYCSNESCPNSEGVARTLTRWATPTSGSTARGSRTGSRPDCRRSPVPGPSPDRPSAAVTLRDPRRSARAGVDAQETGRDGEAGEAGGWRRARGG